MKVRCLLISVVALFVACVLTVPGYATIDQKTIAGIWLFDEGSGKIAKDSSGNKNDGDLIGGPKWVDGKFGKALQFNGVDNYVDAGNGSSLNLSSTGTVAFWFMINELGRYEGIVSRNDLKDTDRNGYTVRSQGDGRVVAEIADASSNMLSWSTTHITIGTWYFIVYEWDGKTVQFYINGTLESGAPQTLNPKSDVYDLFIGCEHETNGDPTYYFNGTIDEVAIFNVALTEDDIKNLMEKGIKALGLAPVFPKGKLTTVWGEIKAK